MENKEDIRELANILKRNKIADDKTILIINHKEAFNMEGENIPLFSSKPENGEESKCVITIKTDETN